ncbi:MFS transporter [bacterium]|jgi:MFS family permease|nr:MFS transporter [bacterium]
MTSSVQIPPPRKFTTVDWLICIIASIGFAFDIYELLMLPLIAGPAFTELSGLKPGTPEFIAQSVQWRSLLFYVPAFVGGALGLVGGYLTDIFGRRRVLTWSILLYAFSAFAAGFSTSLWMLLIFRCLTFAGFCVEFVAAVAWLAELFPNPQQREKVLGYTQAFSSLGGLLVAMVNEQMAVHAANFPAIAGGHSPWRYTLISGVIPALPLILIRPFLPESPIWKSKRDAGTLKRASFTELFQPALVRTTIVTALMVACSYGAAFGAIQQFPEIVKGLKPISEEKNPKEQQKAAARAQQFQEWGGLMGRIAIAGVALYIVSRRGLIRLFQIPGLVALPFVFAVLATSDLNLARWGIFVVGFFTVAQYSFWGNYLPRVFPVHLRGTGEGFAMNVGGRMIGVLAAPIALNLSPVMTGDGAPAKLAMAAAVVGTACYLLGIILSFFLPEPTEEHEGV